MYLQAPAASAVDTVGTYLGMRKVSLDRVSPTSPLRIFLNNNATLQIGLLDQVSRAFNHTHCHHWQRTREESALHAGLWQHLSLQFVGMQAHAHGRTAVFLIPRRLSHL